VAEAATPPTATFTVTGYGGGMVTVLLNGHHFTPHGKVLVTMDAGDAGNIIQTTTLTADGRGNLFTDLNPIPNAACYVGVELQDLHSQQYTPYTDVFFPTGFGGNCQPPHVTLLNPTTFEAGDLFDIQLQLTNFTPSYTLASGPDAYGNYWQTTAGVFVYLDQQFGTFLYSNTYNLSVAGNGNIDAAFQIMLPRSQYCGHNIVVWTVDEAADTDANLLTFATQC
jgi:hypothetical protein